MTSYTRALLASLLMLPTLAQGATITLAWEPPTTLPALQPGETLGYQLWEQRGSMPEALPSLAVPWGTHQQTITYPTPTAGQRLCWRLTARHLSATGGIMTESAFASGANNAIETTLCVAGAPMDQELSRRGWSVQADSADQAYPARYAIDRAVTTFWHTPWVGTVPPHPHLLTITLPQARMVTTLRYLPRQDGNLSGNLARYAVDVRGTPQARWRTVATGMRADGAAPLLVPLGMTTPITAIRLRSLSAFGGAAWVNAADIALFGPAVR
jgi:hypothetical protein